MVRATTLVLVLASVACGAGDNSAVRAFHPTVQVGESLPALIAEGEKAQAYDIEYIVRGRGCPGDELRVERRSEEPSIRVSGPPPDNTEPWNQPYTQTGYASRDDFARGLAELLPKFYSCKDFVFTFGRFQGWPNTDSFSVTVDPDGKVTSVTALIEDDVQ